MAFKRIASARWEGDLMSGKGALGTYSPLLDGEGNSVRGQLAARAISGELGLDILASRPVSPRWGTR